MSSWSEERRKDRAAAAEQVRADRLAAAQIGVQQRRVDNEARVAALKVRAAEARKNRAEHRDLREKRAKRLRQWLVDEAPAAIVMGAPMLLAWTAMAAYGHQIYGPVGWILPLFSEAAMVWFALAVRRAVREKNRPVGWLRVGLVVFAAQSAALNFVHGIAGPGGSWDRGVVMAVVAVGGVTVHQLITAGPRTGRSRAERMQARTTQLARRRVAAIQRAAVCQALGELADDGTVRLVYRAGVVTLQRHGWLRRVRVIEALPVVPDPATAAAPEPLVPPTAEPVVPPAVPDGSALADEVALWLAAQTVAGGSHLAGPAPTPGTTPAADPVGNRAGNREPGGSGNQSSGAAGTTEADLLARAWQAVHAGDLPRDPSKRDVQRVLKCRAAVAGRIAKAIKDDEGGAVPARR